MTAEERDQEMRKILLTAKYAEEKLVLLAAVCDSFAATQVELHARPSLADLEHTWALARGKRRLSNLERREAGP